MSGSGAGSPWFRGVAGLGLVFVLGAGAGWLVRKGALGIDLTGLSRMGPLGFAVGSFLADAFQFPVPPQAYMLVAMAGEVPLASSLLAICLGSMGGALVAYLLARRLARVSFVAGRLERSRPLLDVWGRRIGRAGPLLVIASPVPYSMMALAAGLYRLPWRLVPGLLLLRVPRLLLTFAMLRLGWAVSF